MSNEKKSAFLGIPFGTACNKLRKIVLFNILKKHGENLCKRCGKEIEFISELSLEHIKPWEGISVELFWDLNNIGFSHLHCNVRAASKPNKKYFTPEDKLIADRKRNATLMRKRYTTEKRREKKERTGW